MPTKIPKRYRKNNDKNQLSQFNMIIIPFIIMFLKWLSHKQSIEISCECSEVSYSRYYFDESL